VAPAVARQAELLILSISAGLGPAVRKN